MSETLAALRDAMTLSQALRNVFPRGRSGRPIHTSTGMRWITEGCLSATGERVRLEAFKLGGEHYVTLEACEKFVKALSNFGANPSSEGSAPLEKTEP